MLHYVTTAVAILAVSCGSASAINIAVTPDEEYLYVLRSSSRDSEYDCRTDFGVVLWQIFDYQLIDRDLYFREGLIINTNNNGAGSTLRLTPDGRNFSLTEFASGRPFVVEKERCEAEVIKLWCFVLYDSVRTQLGPLRKIVVFDLNIGTEFNREDNTTTVTWCPPQLTKDPQLTSDIAITYNITIRDVDNDDNMISDTTSETQYVVPDTFTCQQCDISVLYESEDGNEVSGAGVETTYRTTIPFTVDLTGIELEIGFSGPNVTVECEIPVQDKSQPITQYTVNLQDVCPCNCQLNMKKMAFPDVNDTKVKVTFQDVRIGETDATTPIYTASLEACSDTSCQSTPSVVSDASEIMSAEVVQNMSSSCLLVNFMDSSSPEACVTFAATVNGFVQRANITKNNDYLVKDTSNNYTVLSPFPIAGDDVVFYDCGAPLRIRPASIRNSSGIICSVPPSEVDPVDGEALSFPIQLVIGIIVGILLLVVVIILAIVIGGVLVMKLKKKGKKEVLPEKEKIDINKLEDEKNKNVYEEAH